MTSPRMTDGPVPMREHVPTADRVVVLGLQNWAAYETLLELRGEERRPRIDYLDGVIFLMSPSRPHDYISRGIGTLLIEFCVETNVACFAFGSWTHKAQAQEAGLEPDECFVFGDQHKPRADLAIEVNWTHGGTEKLEIYRRLLVPEVWLWEDDKIVVYRLEDERYRVAERSVWLPELDLALVVRLATVEPTTEAIRQLRAAIRK